ncbi:hypothetical protein OPV22_009086 [Ensete ventricosum]|uniref:Uncharacterized protein n=1 Tax=Ensete ventricosum TaxID=4639 RepID=A0AAV8PRF4_ENSVE|nr:hypothetical protein OPV22_009086 [Ensete ventricosum]
MVEVAAAAAAAAAGSCSLRRLPLVHGGAAGSRRDAAATWRWPKRKEEMASTKKHRLHHRSRAPTAARSCANDANISGFDSRPGIVTFSSNISTDIPLHEPPGVSFDEYLYDRPRVFRAMFPDKRRSQRLNDEEWRIQMLPIQFLFASVNPVVVMQLRHKSSGEDYPAGVPGHATSVLELQATRWELHGLQGIQMPPHFALSVQGVLYPDRSSSSSSSSRLKGHLEMGISMILPPVLQLVPEDVLKSIADTVLWRLLKTMKHEVDGGLISDYAKFLREKLKKHAQTPATSSELRGSS